jgi:hypothetical protein
MTLEERVKVLEDELSILKNQIQSTLLDIQEQILVSRYPTLRSQEPTSGSVRPPSDNGSHRRAPAFAGVQTVFLKDQEGEVALEQDTLQEALGKEEATGKEPNSARAPSRHSLASRPAAAEEASSVPLAELTAWVGSSVAKIGKERTGKAIEIYAQGGYLAAETEDMLLRLLSLADQEVQPEQFGFGDVVSALSELDAVLHGEADRGVPPWLMEEDGLG